MTISDETGSTLILASKISLKNLGKVICPLDVSLTSYFILYSPSFALLLTSCHKYSIYGGKVQTCLLKKSRSACHWKISFSLSLRYLRSRLIYCLFRIILRFISIISTLSSLLLTATIAAFLSSSIRLFTP